MNRRRFLALASIGATGTVAGCTGLEGGGSGTDGRSGDGSMDNESMDDGSMDNESMDDGSTSNESMGDGSMGDGSSTAMAVEDHPSVTDLAAQPHLGEFGGHVIVAFEDPSCPRCAAFEQRVVPEIRSNLVEPGKAAYVVRTYPVVYPWGEPASHALEATYDRDAGAFWSLLDHYVSDQSSFSTDTVLDRTASFLDAETGLDGSAVVADVEGGGYDDAVTADLDAGEAAGARATPTVFLFRDGQYVTSAAGSVSYDVIAGALGER